MTRCTRRDMLKITAGAVVMSPVTGQALQATSQQGPLRPLSPSPHADLYIAPNGDDEWSGKLATANEQGTDGPVASFSRARVLVREMKRLQTPPSQSP